MSRPENRDLVAVAVEPVVTEVPMSAKFSRTNPHAMSGNSFVKYPIVVLSVPALRLLIASLARYSPVPRARSIASSTSKASRKKGTASAIRSIGKL
jgi:hypothetical protein